MPLDPRKYNRTLFRIPLIWLIADAAVAGLFLMGKAVMLELGRILAVVH